MSSFKITLSGLDVVKKGLAEIPVKMGERIIDSFQAFADNVHEDAVRFAPTDEGALKNSIQPFVKADNKEIIAEIVVGVDYAAYLEFGTRKFAASYVASLPSDWQTFAAQFKGPGGGSLSEMLVRLQAWVLRKGFAAELTKSGNKSKSKSSLKTQEQAAYEIAIQILLNGIKPHPFLKPAIDKNLPLLVDNLKIILSGKK